MKVSALPPATAGSSPLTRGKPRHHRRDTRTRGLIPAHAGKTQSGPSAAGVCRAHPRSRGENALDVDPTDVDDGSSPLTRGKRALGSLGSTLVRLIPAHAGKTSVRSTRRPTGRAHPRSRGENELVNTRVVQLRGSSPLTRGKLVLAAALGGRDRLIPAHAGKTHPRAVGGHGHKGSSPLTRGKLAWLHPYQRRRGLIPAHAGKTFGDLAGEVVAGAHPRSRGENAPLSEASATHGGSSPLTRGKPWSARR